MKGSWRQRWGTWVTAVVELSMPLARRTHLAAPVSCRQLHQPSRGWLSGDLQQISALSVRATASSDIPLWGGRGVGSVCVPLHPQHPHSLLFQLPAPAPSLSHHLLGSSSAQISLPTEAPQSGTTCHPTSFSSLHPRPQPDSEAWELVNIP